MNFFLPILLVWLVIDLVSDWKLQKLLVLLTALCWLVLDNFWRLKAHGTKSTATIAHVPMRRKLWLVFRSYGLYYLPLGAVPALGLRIIPERGVWIWAGLVMCVGGIGFTIWSRHVLAKNWNVSTTLEEGHTLIQSGPYAIVRHPIYAGMLFAMLGTGFVIGEMRAFVNLVATLAEGWGKLNQEEIILQKEFPDEYPIYKRKVRKLIPGIL